MYVSTPYRALVASARDAIFPLSHKTQFGGYGFKFALRRVHVLFLGGFDEILKYI